MVKQHPFILQAGTWLGEGKITLSMMDAPLPFLTVWKVSALSKKGQIDCLQEIQIQGLADTMQNRFNLYHIASRQFHIELANQSFGKIIGEGLITDRMIGWEFRANSFGFEGFEFYETTSSLDTYLFHAEYATEDDCRTVIHGHIKKKTK